MNTAEQVVLVKRKIVKIESAIARGIDRHAVFEIAELSGLAHKLHEAAEREYQISRDGEEHRAKCARDAAASSHEVSQCR